MSQVLTAMGKALVPPSGLDKLLRGTRGRGKSLDSGVLTLLSDEMPLPS